MMQKRNWKAEPEAEPEAEPDLKLAPATSLANCGYSYILRGKL